MTNINKQAGSSMLIGILVGAIIGIALTFLAYQFLTPNVEKPSAANTTTVKKPKYWVAPMDANYRRDKPGKSPMGMDLVPVYDDGGKGPDEGAGTIRISPNVVNNLGVRTVTASYQKLASTINTVGFITFDENKFVHIHPRVQGWVEKLYVKAVGDPISKGQALYDLYSPELVNAQEELLLALTRNNKQLIQAAENRLTALKLSKNMIKKLKSSKKVQQVITFYAPQSGVVENLAIREGFYVKLETQLLSIVDLSKVWLKAEVFERQSAVVAMGDKVTIKIGALANKRWQGRVEHIHPMLNAKTRTYVVRLSLDNSDGELKPNMFAELVIEASKTGDNASALIIPKEALIRTGSQNRVVLALGEGSYKSVAVTIGRFDSDHVEILSGLSAGEQVVSSAQFLLDSESSKSSDFKRMNHDEMNIAIPDEITVSSATVNGIVNSVMTEHRMVNIAREAIKKWNRPADDVDFIIAESVDISLFTKGARVMFTFEVGDEDFVIVSAMAMPMNMGMNSENKPSDKEVNKPENNQENKQGDKP